MWRDPEQIHNPGVLCQACVSATREHDLTAGQKLIDGKKIARLRKDLGMTQVLFAARVGVSASLVQKIEVNILRSTRLSTLNAMATVLGVNVSTLLEGGPQASISTDTVSPEQAPAIMDLSDVLTDYGFGLGAAQSLVLDSGLSLDTSALPIERRVRYMLDVARAHSMAGNRDEALGTMLAAERMAPEHVRQHHLSAKVVTTMVQGTRGRAVPELGRLANRIKVRETC